MDAGQWGGFLVALLQFGCFGFVCRLVECCYDFGPVLGVLEEGGTLRGWCFPWFLFCCGGGFCKVLPRVDDVSWLKF